MTYQKITNFLSNLSDNIQLWEMPANEFDFDCDLLEEDDTPQTMAVSIAYDLEQNGHTSEAETLRQL